MKTVTSSRHCERTRSIEASQQATRIDHYARQAHPHCFACSPWRVDGLRLQFHLIDDSGRVSAKLQTSEAWQGYPGVVHGGLIATLLDAAMVHCLFVQGITAWTADLRVRFRHPVPCNVDIEVEAWVTSVRSRMFDTRAHIRTQDGVLALGAAKFMLIE